MNVSAYCMSKARGLESKVDSTLNRSKMLKIETSICIDIDLKCSEVLCEIEDDSSLLLGKQAKGYSEQSGCSSPSRSSAVLQEVQATTLRTCSLAYIYANQKLCFGLNDDCREALVLNFIVHLMLLRIADMQETLKYSHARQHCTLMSVVFGFLCEFTLPYGTSSFFSGISYLFGMDFSSSSHF
ncbi:hypothetical protein C5167_024696 [Papaver somniferum]|uniref:Uncharacterized protein n=1 Tax=Papaver somniferum TaxID=3469 RepID=A0A4Y7JPE5_PAPSO|nr:hypothetical protein C5167_024696 [Papaver somniferum]